MVGQKRFCPFCPVAAAQKCSVSRRRSWTKEMAGQDRFCPARTAAGHFPERQQKGSTMTKLIPAALRHARGSAMPHVSRRRDLRATGVSNGPNRITVAAGGSSAMDSMPSTIV